MELIGSTREEWSQMKGGGYLLFEDRRSGSRSGSSYLMSLF